MTHRKQYEEWIDDAAVGALDPRRERELLAHAGECNVCRDAYQHARELATFVDRSVESLVAGEPSPHFLARLRTRIAEEQPSRRSGWLTSKMKAVGAVAAIAFAVLFIFLASRHTSLLSKSAQPGSNIASTIPPATHTSAKPTTDAAWPDRGASTVAQRRSMAHRQVASRLVAEPRHSIHRTLSPAEAEVLVPPGQLEAVMQLAADIDSGRIDGKQFLAARKQLDKPIEIQPMKIQPIPLPALSGAQPERPSDSDAP